MAISLSGVLKAFFVLIVYYGMYAVISSTVEGFSSTSSNLFDIFLVLILPLIIFFAIIISIFKTDESRGYRG